MTIALVIACLESRNILLSFVDGEIRYRSPKDALTSVDKEILSLRRNEIIDHLQARNAARSLRTATEVNGPLTPSVAQEMWHAFAGGAEEGKPIALNIAMIGKFRHPPQAVSAAVLQVIKNHTALRTRFEVHAGDLKASANPAEAFEIQQDDLHGLSRDTAGEVAMTAAHTFGSKVNLIEGQWLTRAKVIALPEGESLAVISSAHMISDGGTRDIIAQELQDILDFGAPLTSPPIQFNDYSLAERDFLAGPQGEQLIDYWRRWYHRQPGMKAPSDGQELLWGNGIRIVRNFTIPGHFLEKVRALAAEMKVTPFLIYLTIFSVTIARWAGQERFPLRVLGDKRTSLNLSHTAGLMFCADAMEINVPSDADFEAVMHGIRMEYDTARALRIPTLHFWAPHCVRPGIEEPDYPNKIPAVFNYASVGTAREQAEKMAGPDTTAGLPWPPQVTTLPPQQWPRRSSPLFLHLTDMGNEAVGSLHFFQGSVSPPDQDKFTALFFKIFEEIVPFHQAR